MIIPKHYKIHLEPDLKTFDCPGWTEIDVEMKESSRELRLNGAEMMIGECWAEWDGRRKECSVSPLEEESQSFAVGLPEAVKGMLKLRVHFTSRINESMLGFYRSRFEKKDGGRGTIAVTQFEETHARKAFPCFDDPALKATFDIEFVIDEKMTGISNMPVAVEEPMPSGKKRVCFATTPLMSTYLLFFGIGEFEILEDQGTVLLRAVTTPGKIGMAGEGLRFARKCLAFLEEQFGTKYPLPKLDLIAVPDFAAGAMENWGAMTFRENLLLVYPGITSRRQVERIFAVIAHETVHMWFGDLVSPAEWKYLWLNESFATLYGDIAVDHCFPEWKVMENFVLESTASALARDALRETIPVELGEEARITAATVPIIYDKGGAVMRMAIDFLGEKIRNALRDYFKRFSFGIAKSSDLWSAFDSAAPGEPVEEMMISWVKQPGYPIVKVKREENGLVFFQERFTYLERAATGETWIIPLSILLFDDRGKSRRLHFLLNEKKGRLEVKEPFSAFLLNHGRPGFYRVDYDPEDRARVGKTVREKRLDGLDRYGVAEDLMALVRAGREKIDTCLDFIESFYANEDHHLPMRGILSGLAHFKIIGEPSVDGRVTKLGRKIAENALDIFGYEPVKDEPLTNNSIRNSALWNGLIFGSQKTETFLLERFQRREKTGEALPADIAEAVQRGAAYADPQGFSLLAKRFKKSESEQERMTIASAMGCVRPENMDAAVDFALKSVPPRLRFVPFSTMAGNPSLGPHLWEMFRAHHKDLENLPPFHLERIIIVTISVGGLYHEKEVKEFFASYAPESLKNYQKYLKTTINMALEILEVNLSLNTQLSCP
ncbi:MAG: M1 family metallopeptidase [Candidatus Aminicenantes bacterium]|nr:M1 family metallopeptidase [Candidatus Aminicenantes bacterium]